MQKSLVFYIEHYQKISLDPFCPKRNKKFQTKIMGFNPFGKFQFCDHSKINVLIV